MEENNKNLTDLLAFPAPDEVALVNPPLKMVLAQIRFPAILDVNQLNSPQVASFQSAIRGDYPNYEEIQSAILQLQLLPGQDGQNVPQQMPQQMPQPMRHVFNSNDGWSISLTRDFIALSTTAYKTKKDFVGRIQKLAEAFKNAFQPTQVTRLGIRFVDRVEDQSILDDIGKYVNPQFLVPFLGVPKILVTQSQLTLPGDVSLNLNWGKIPPNHMLQVDIPPYEGFSWMLDSDMYAQECFDFDPEQIAERTDIFSRQIYAIFRHVFNDDFLRTCGGKV